MSFACRWEDWANCKNGVMQMSFTITEIASVIAIIGTTAGTLIAIFQVVKKAEERLDQRFNESEKQANAKFSVVWRRFDEHKALNDNKIDKCLETVENKYVRNDIYKVNIDSMQSMMEQQYSSLSKLIDERLNHINDLMEEIRKCPALRNGHNADKG